MGDPPLNVGQIARTSEQRTADETERAEKFVLSKGTVKTHAASVRKLRLRDRVQAVTFASESGLLESGMT
jgi:DNA-binding CsgD family transcriptional regulator